MNKIKMEIVTPNGTIFSDEIAQATLPGSEGEFGVLPGHSGVVTLLNAGVIEIEKSDGKKEMVAIDWGHAKVDEGKITILADGAVAVGEGDISESIAKAKELVASMSDSDAIIAAATAKLESAAKGNF
jgi:F-type H+-transporting ATPase subunit epsilon